MSSLDKEGAIMPNGTSTVFSRHESVLSYHLMHSKCVLEITAKIGKIS